MRNLSEQEMTMLESAIDATSLQVVVNAIAHIAYAKGAHLRENWQDRTSARVWDEAGDALVVMSQRSAVLNVSV